MPDGSEYAGLSGTQTTASVPPGHAGAVPGSAIGHIRLTYARRDDLGQNGPPQQSLQGAVLRGADLAGADMRGVDLKGAALDGADLSGADLRAANLLSASLRNADLSGANLKGALVTDEQLGTAKTLAGATLPDGRLAAGSG
jgi:uncharacterized protein YjbI with pentapeptide repeats